VFVNGTARFAFTLEVGAGADPQAWQPVSRGIGGEESRLLGVWQADTFEPGEYTLRLRVVTPEGLPVEATQVVRVE
jgi:hypothetical protein